MGGGGGGGGSIIYLKMILKNLLTKRIWCPEGWFSRVWAMGGWETVEFYFSTQSSSIKISLGALTHSLT